MLSAWSFKDTADQVGCSCTATSSPYNRRHAVICMCVLSSSRAASLGSAKYANPTNRRSPGALPCAPGTLMLAMNVGYTIRPICWAPPAAGTDTARPLEREIFKSCIAALGSATEPRIMWVSTPCFVHSQPALQSTFRPTAASVLKQRAIK